MYITFIIMLTLTLNLTLTLTILTYICESQALQLIMALPFALLPPSLLQIAIVIEEGVEGGAAAWLTAEHECFVR